MYTAKRKYVAVANRILGLDAVFIIILFIIHKTIGLHLALLQLYYSLKYNSLEFCFCLPQTTETGSIKKTKTGNCGGETERLYFIWFFFSAS